MSEKNSGDIDWKVGLFLIAVAYHGCFMHEKLDDLETALTALCAEAKVECELESDGK